VTQGDFHRFISAKTIRASGDHSNLVVQARDGTAGDFPLGLKPVQQQVLMRVQHPRHFLHRLPATAQSRFGPDLQEVTRPGRRMMALEGWKGFLEDPRPGGRQFAGGQSVELRRAAPRIAGGRLMTPRALGGNAGVRQDDNLNVPCWPSR
jgi:hypothetical protein